MQNTSQRVSASQIRGIFPGNLKKLIGSIGTIKSVSDDIGIPRQQLSRYISGQSIPNVENLNKLCAYFNVDARILLEELQDFYVNIAPGALAPFCKTFGLPEFYTDARQSKMPNGIYRMWKPTFANNTIANVALLAVRESNGAKILTGLDPVALRTGAIGGKIAPTRERRFTGVVLQIRNSQAIISEMMNSAQIACTLLQQETRYLLPPGSYLGLCSATIPGTASTYDTIVPVVYEYIPSSTGAVLAAARQCGAIPMDELPEIVVQAFQMGLKPYFS